MTIDILEKLSSDFSFIMLLVSVICYWANLYLFSFRLKTSFQLNAENLLFRTGKLSALIGNILLGCILGFRWISAGYFPLSNLYESLLFLTWILLTVYFYIESKTKSKLIGATLIPIALFISAFSNLTLSPEMQKASPLVPALQSNWLMLHVSMMLLSYGTLIMGSLLCILFLTISYYQKIDFQQTEKTKTSELSSFYSTSLLYETSLYYLNVLSTNKTISTVFLNKRQEDQSKLTKVNKLILLENLDNWSYRILGLGFPFLTIGIIAGGVWANEAWGSYWSWDPKETWALITWIVFATYLHARITKGWKGRKTALLGGLGFFVIWICYLGVNFLGKGLHSYGWVS